MIKPRLLLIYGEAGDLVGGVRPLPLACDLISKRLLSQLMAQRWCTGLFLSIWTCEYKVRLSCAAPFLRCCYPCEFCHCFDRIRELTPATDCWTRWNPGTLNSSASGTKSCREITVFHVAVPPPPADSLPGHDWAAAAFILTRWSRGLTVAYPPSRLLSPHALHPPTPTKLPQAPFYKPHGRSQVLHFIQPPPPSQRLC